MARVLIADKCADTRESLTWLLRLWGHEVETARDGVELLRLARDGRPDAILTEVALPRLDGYQAARRLRELPGLERVLLVALTGYSAESYRLRGLEAGFDHYLVKPVDPEEVCRLLSFRTGRRSGLRPCLSRN